MHCFSRLSAGFLLLLCLSPTIVSAQWEKVRGPFGGNLQTLFVHETGIYAGTYSAGAFRSTDDGRTWQSLDTTSRLPSVLSFHAHGGLLYAATSAGVILSEDGGTHWRLLRGEGLQSTIFSSPPPVYNLAWQGETMFASVGGVGGQTIRRSTDGGDTWQSAGTGAVLSNYLALYADDSVLLAGGTGAVEGAIYRSTNGGSSWSRVANFTYHDARKFLPHSTGILAATDNGLYRSTDVGATWTHLAGAGIDIMDITEAPDGTLYTACPNDGGGLYRSTDSGTTWTRVNKNLPTYKLQYPTVNVVAATSSAVLCNPYLDGIYRSSDGGANWSRSTAGIAASNVVDIAAGSDGLFAATDGNGLQHSADLGATWQNVGPGFASPRVTAVAAMADIVFAATTAASGSNSESRLYRSTDNGTSWREFSWTQNSRIKAILLDSGEVFVVTSASVSRSTNNGESWSSAGTGLPGATINVIAADRGRLVVGTSAGIYRSVDRGATWTKLAVAPGGSNDVLSVVMVEDTIIAGTASGGICRSTDGGATWTRKYGSNAIPAMIRAGSTLFASGGSFGVVRSNDNGASWELYNQGLSRIGPVDFVFHGGYLFAGIGFASIARRAVEPGTVGVGGSTVQAGAAVIHPNPATGRSVRVQLPASLRKGEVRLYSAAGAVLHAEPLVETDALTLDVTQLPAGVYVVRVSGDGGTVYAGRLIVL